MPITILKPEEKFAFLAGVSTSAARTVLSGADSQEFEDVEASTDGLADLRRMATSPGRLAGIRLNPNRLTERQIQHLPRLAVGRATRIMRGGPYFTLEEFEMAAGLPRPLLGELLEVPVYRALDKTTGRYRRMQPVPGLYVGPEVGSSGIAEPGGFETVRGVSKRSRVRIYRATSFEAQPEPHVLKSALDGRVLPALQDQDGLTRYLVPLRIDVWFRRGTPMDEATDIVEAVGLRPLAGHYRVFHTACFCPAEFRAWPQGDPLAATLAAIARVQQFEQVLFAEPDEIGLADFPPASAVRASEGELESAGRFWNLEMVDLAGAQTCTEGSSRVTIFTVDSGIRLDHADLAPALREDWGNYDLNYSTYDPEAETSPSDAVIGHGTRVASVAVAQGTPSAPDSARGMARLCKFVPVKIDGLPTAAGYGFRAAAIRQATSLLRPGERGVLNLSWGMGGDHIGIREALREADQHDIAIAVSAGNYVAGETQVADKIHFPSAYTHLEPRLASMCSVAAFNADGRRASYSYFGPTSVSFAAPGGELGGAGSGVYVASLGPAYSYAAGTSFAAPHVAGLIALLFSLDPTLTAAQAIQLIRDTCDRPDAAQEPYWDKLGAGFINAGRAVSTLARRVGGSPGVTTPGPSTPSVPPPPVFIPPANGRVNINTALEPAFENLPSVTGWHAEAAVHTRRSRGRYETVWHLVFTGAWDFGLIASLGDQIYTG